ncbi:MAG TPA: 12-oxophytodienoate reductase [Candidatus Latescibacteria bacterium]|nr:12-oxophytodienoate reductase [Candidatus Handelsmanbacteria bacterium]HIL11848.1 12-oxophytodienoate reductase [Candidatus Latescibacterota bacterium]
MITALSQPYKIKDLDLRNRFVMAPMTRKQSPGGVPTSIVAEYYHRRAAGGVGLLITEGTVVEHRLAANSDQIPRIAEDTAAAWQAVLAKIEPTGSKTFVQLWHQGPINRPGIAARSVVEEGREVVVQAEGKALQELFNAFVAGAVSAQKIGFDGIELHGAHGYLIDSFLRAGQLAFVCDLVREIRRQVGPVYPLGIRFSQWTVRDFEAKQFATPQELEKTLLALKDAGIDFLHASTRRFWLPEFDGSDLNLAGWSKKIADLPTITVGNVGLVTGEFFGDGPQSKQELMRRFDRGEFDLVAIGRPLLSDADWCNKVVDGLQDEIIDFNDEALKVYP